MRGTGKVLGAHRIARSGCVWKGSSMAGESGSACGLGQTVCLIRDRASWQLPRIAFEPD